MALLGLTVLVRFVLEALGVSPNVTRFFSASVLVGLEMLYVGAVAPLRGVTKVRQLALPAFALSAVLGGGTALSLLVSGLFELPASHFAHAPPEPLYPRFWFHVLEHVGVIPVAAVVTFGIMAVPFSLHRWPVTVAPATVLGALVLLRFAAEAMSVAPTTASAWSSTVGLLLSALYLGGIGPRMGLVSPRQLLAPAFVVAFVWRFWILLAALVSVVLGFETHFFDPSQGRVAARLLSFLWGPVLTGGLVGGLLTFGIAVWVARNAKGRRRVSVR
jgi:hypothetical protein